MEKNYHKDNKSFALYKDWEELFEALSDEETGQLLRALFAYAKRGEETEFTGALKMAYITMRNCLERDGKKWEEKCIKNAENGRKGGYAKKANSANGCRSAANVSEAKRPLANLADKDKDTDTDKDKDTDKDTDKEKEAAIAAPAPDKSGDEDCVCDFEKFFSSYPKKVSKLKAFREWNRINPSSDTAERIIAAVHRQRDSENWKKENGRFIPFPEKYLRDRRWEDDLSDLSSVSQKSYSFDLDEYKSLVNNFSDI